MYAVWSADGPPLKHFGRCLLCSSTMQLSRGSSRPTSILAMASSTQQGQPFRRQDSLCNCEIGFDNSLWPQSQRLQPVGLLDNFCRGSQASSTGREAIKAVGGPFKPASPMKHSPAQAGDYSGTFSKLEATKVCATSWAQRGCQQWHCLNVKPATDTCEDYSS